ncbi:hypothetical protein [Colwellia sp. MEBiC06753]
MKYLIATDIFGHTQALDEFIQALNLSGQVEIFCPYQAVTRTVIKPCFENEATAYQYFTQHIGLDAYANALFDYISKQSEPVSLLGFSVGASVIWQIADKLSTDGICVDAKSVVPTVTGALCFYSSQVRHMLTQNTSVPITFVFPKAEQHFDVHAVMATLAEKPLVKCGQVAFNHGYINQLSANFDIDGYQQVIVAINQLADNASLHLVKY